ncbi:MAG: sialate O-acetylesterase [Prevotella sp.]|nr:sialate O-acetylesterase [Prevotella sp.]
MNLRVIALAALMAFAGWDASAKVKLPAFFSSGMVLQQQTTCRIWGTASTNSRVKVVTSWNGKHYQTVSNAQGQFEVKVATPAAGGPYSITLDDGEKTTLDSILIGEVWLCSGQSNMEMPIKGFKAQPVEGAINEILNGADDNLRFFSVKRNPALTPLSDVTGKWTAANSASIREFSATAYFFGKQLRASLKVPVGLLLTAYGGSACEAWQTGEWLKAFPEVKLPTGQETVDKLKQRCPTALYNGMLHPLIGYGIRGAIWYQGEDNVNRYANYARLMKSMVEGWRQEWGLGDFPFYYCQIAPYDYSLIKWDMNSAFLREQQLKAESMISNCRMAVLMDAGLEYGIHPRKKQLAGQRLAMLALANTYGVKGLPDYAVYSSMEIHGDTCVLRFDRSKEWVYFNNGTTSNLFKVAGADRVFHPAQAWVSGNRVYVKSTEVGRPVAVRYAFTDWAEGDLFHDGLPVSSFRTDNWDDVK